MPHGPERGIDERIVSEGLARILEETQAGGRLRPVRDELADAEAADRLALHLASVVERAVAALPERSRAGAGIALVRRLVESLAEHCGDAEWRADAPVTVASVLRGLARRLPDGSFEALEPPLVPLLDTTLLTNSPGEPRVLAQLLSEVATARRIDVVMAFIRRSGVQPLRDALRRHCEDGRALRVLTTTYTGSTEARALEMLVALGAEVRVSYDVGSTRLHAKSWLFDRGAGISTAYVGSSNLTHSAQVTGLEWNVRVSSARNRTLVDKLRAVFDAYWESGDFVSYTREEFLARAPRNDAESGTTVFFPTELRLEPFQERLLEQIEIARGEGHAQNLLVAATGTGKTVMAAVDYRRLRTTLPRARLLFVAHRKELLQQALATFRHALREPAFGELWVDGALPRRWEHVFASIQSLNAAGLRHIEPDQFDVVILDEFHHAAAASYTALLDHLRPEQLLGLTATPERADGLSVLQRFGGRIAAELRLWDAIEQHRLVPFLYFGVADGTDLSGVGWTRGRGYDVQGLTNVYTQDDLWAGRVLDALAERVDRLSLVRALGFCVSVEHARFMARVFRERGVAAVAVWGDSPADEREAALRDLRRRAVNVVFSVDLFNEGVDVPEVDTLLLLRPTESATLFLQQLGRGLRRADGKSACLVLDFIGQHRREFRYDLRFRALLAGTRRDVERQVQLGFPLLPAGCHLELDDVAREVVLRSLKSALPSTWTKLAAEARAIADTRGGDVTLATFLAESGLELADVYAQGRSWSDLREAAGLAVAPARTDGNGSDVQKREAALRRACGRLLHVDDVERLDGIAALVSAPDAPRFSARFAERDARLARQLTSQLSIKGQSSKSTTLNAGLELLWRHPQVLAELRELCAALRGRVAHVHPPLVGHDSVPLQVFGRYTRLEILAAFDAADRAHVPPWQTGVMWLEEARVDLLAFTLDKSSRGFSPTTRYRDYAISRDLIHWESQSVTRADGETGTRYRAHVARGSSVMLFARERAADRAFWFLGPATYQGHVGERPMAITWRLLHPLPGDLYARLAAALA